MIEQRSTALAGPWTLKRSIGQGRGGPHVEMGRRMWQREPSVRKVKRLASGVPANACDALRISRAIEEMGGRGSGGLVVVIAASV